MRSERVQAFSDGVLAVIITIMVLELAAPHGNSWAALLELWPKFLVYLVSFLYVGIYWNNHHHVFQVVQRVNGSVLWANLGLLFSLSLFPLATAWAGDEHFAAAPLTFYSIVAWVAGLMYSLLVHRLIRCDVANQALADATKSGVKEKLSLVGYTVAAVTPWLGSVGRLISGLLLIGVACMWVIPDRRIERVIAQARQEADRS